eukprot:TRINITY_DN62573_c0_g1_i1.p1 TRINITY_DN62573_c0_g1~~TRINITY_DN62573_c0_g1_i1.p1  ORF type:complete len:108 (-),score=30.88 TRINITY_DN62573_c0_g1_i1:32-355(-)
MPPKRSPKTEAGWEAHKKALLELITAIRGDPSATNTNSVANFKSKMQWRTEIFNVLTNDQTAARYYYNNIIAVIEHDLEENVVQKVVKLVKNQDEDALFTFLSLIHI